MGAINPGMLKWRPGSGKISGLPMNIDLDLAALLAIWTWKNGSSFLIGAETIKLSKEPMEKVIRGSMRIETATVYRASSGRRYFTLKGALKDECYSAVKKKYPLDPCDCVDFCTCGRSGFIGDIQALAERYYQFHKRKISTLRCVLKRD